MAEVVITPKGRVSYAYVFDPAKKQNSDQTEWRCSLIFDDKADLSALKKIVHEAVKNKWGDNPPKGLRNPIRENDEKSDKAGYDIPGHYINTKTDRAAPKIVDQARELITKESGRFYSGCYARASVTAYAYDSHGNRGVAFNLIAMQKLDDGEPLADFVQFDATSDFEAVEGFEATAAGDVDDSIFS